jgi:hypothetical protein
MQNHGNLGDLGLQRIHPKIILFRSHLGEVDVTVPLMYR